ncbi:hypothetical protein BDZ89DRAFT_1075437 [Hymenopellis radicata]|nr:hypothetical protein BDZ89DRAFT_1075437 [Hymenopellis radicata]
MSTPVTLDSAAPETEVAPPPSPTKTETPPARLWTPLFIAKIAALWAISVPILTVLYAAFTLLGYALLSIATIPQGQSLSVFYAALIGSGILLAPICILSLPLGLHPARSFFSSLSKFGMQHLPSVFIVPVILGGSALGLKILQVSGASAQLGDVVDRGHLLLKARFLGVLKTSRQHH